MVEINLLGKSKIKKKKEKKPAPKVSKPILFLFVAVILVVATVYVILPYIMNRQPEIQPITATQQQETTPPPDTTKKETVEEQPVTEKPKTIEIEKPAPQRFEYDFSQNNERITTFLNITNSITSEEEIAIVSVSGSKFLIEVILKSNDNAERLTSNLRNNLKNNAINLTVTNLEDNLIAAKTWGNFSTAMPEKRTSKVYNLGVMIREIFNLAGKSNLIVTERFSKKSYDVDNIRITPIVFKIKGRRTSITQFLTNMKNQDFNAIIEKINLSKPNTQIPYLLLLEFRFIETQN